MTAVLDAKPNWTPESETKADAWRRLEAEGRYAEFRARMRALRKETRGLTKDEAFYNALAEFPPDGSPPEREPEPILSDDGVELEKELAQSTDIEADVRWVLHNEPGYRDAVNGKHKDRERRIEQSAPSGAAVAILRAAIRSGHKFVLEIAPKFLRKADDGDDVETPEDRRRRVNLDGLLEELDKLRECPHCGGRI